MDIAALSSSLAANKYANQGSILVAKKALSQMEVQGQNAVALIQQATPTADTGKGLLVNRYA